MTCHFIEATNVYFVQNDNVTGRSHSHADYILILLIDFQEYPMCNNKKKHLNVYFLLEIYIITVEIS